ncbi:MAG: DNA-binding response regulator [Cytophagia bacterium]|nr:DNA-binding response regulator [Cytophagia bacterium]NBW36099.1 DNA-binding response regulator [Cytophagia bacterium]
MYKILLVEDDNSLGYVLKEYLIMNGFDVTWVRDGEEAFALAKNKSFDLCLLDVMLPKIDGFSLASDLRRLAPSQPLIFLTAKSLKIDKLKGFKLGADDYIVKPVDEEELIARINAVINRTSPEHATKKIVSIGSFEFDLVNSSLTRNGVVYTISSKEAEVLKLLVQTPGILVARKTILNECWGANDYFNRRSMDVIISRLRKYLREDPAVAIINVHGRGFILKINA